MNFVVSVVFIVAYNVLGLCEEADLEAQMFVLAQMFIRIPNVQFSTEAQLLQNPSYVYILINLRLINHIKIERTKAEKDSQTLQA